VTSWCLALAPSAERTLERLPARVAAAMVEFMIGPLLDAPERVGKPLQRGLEGYWSARPGAYRIIYRPYADARIVCVVRVEHRSQVYRLR
jgi:mRNA interferase RelE/StbE